MSKKKKKQNQNKKNEGFHLADLSFLWQILIIVVVAYLLANFIGSIYPVSNNAMKIMVTDTITMEETNKGLQKGDYVMVSRVNYWFLNPQRGDVVMYSVDGDTNLYGRVIGLPGETVSIDDAGFISINGIQFKTPNKELFSQYLTVFLEGQTEYPLVLGENEFFILCDNPGTNIDSRSASVAAVTKDEIIGKVLLKLWPFKRLSPVL